MSYMMEPSSGSRSPRPAVLVGGVVLLLLAAVLAFAVGRAQPGAAGGAGGPAPSVDDIRWAQVGPWLVPTSTAHGPFRSGEGMASGFSHDDLGAALAAFNIIQRFAVELGPQVYVTTVRQQAYGDLETMIAQIRAQPISTGDPVSEMAWKVLAGDTSEDLVLVSIAIRTPGSDAQGGWWATPMTMRWTDGDWRVQVPLVPGQLIRQVEGYHSLGRPRV